MVAYPALENEIQEIQQPKEDHTNYKFAQVFERLLTLSGSGGSDLAQALLLTECQIPTQLIENALPQETETLKKLLQLDEETLASLKTILDIILEDLSLSEIDGKSRISAQVYILATFIRLLGQK